MKNGWLETYTGVKVHLPLPSDDEIVPEDIAHALSMICRYNGHVQRFYSVAEHCCLIYDHVAGLGHDGPTVLGALLAVPLSLLIHRKDGGQP